MKGMRKTLKRRRMEGKTDYKARLGLLKNRDNVRLVVRKTNRYIIAQLVMSDASQDKVVCGAVSKELLSHGWLKNLAGSLKSTAASYLTGKLLGEKAKKKGINRAVLDIGMHRNASGGRIYAVLRGVIDAGVEIPHSKNALPSDKRLEENLKTREMLHKLKEKLHK